MRAGIASALLLCAAVAQAAPVRENLTIESQAQGKPLAIPVVLLLPEGAQAKLPAMVIVHGSGGVREEREFAYANAILKMGVAAAIPDSFTPRGVKSTMLSQAPVPSSEMTGDAMRLLQALVKDPRIDPARIGVIGFSKGGTVALQSAIEGQAARFTAERARFALHIAMYPGCDSQFLNLKTSGAPIRVLIGGSDAYVGRQPCLDYAEKFKTQGANIATKVYPGAQHDWDVPGRSWTEARGENWSNCRFVEQQDGSWIEQTSGIITHAPGARPLPGRAEAIKKCMTYGVSGGYDASTARQSLSDIQDFVKAALRL